MRHFRGGGMGVSGIFSPPCHSMGGTERESRTYDAANKGGLVFIFGRCAVWADVHDAHANVSNVH